MKHTTQPVTAAGKPVVSLYLLQRDPNMTPACLYWPQTNIQLSLLLFLPSFLIHLHSISTLCFSILYWDSLHLTILLGLAPSTSCWILTLFITDQNHRTFSLWNQELVQVLSKSRKCPLLYPHPAALLVFLFAPLLHHLFHAAQRKISLERFCSHSAATVGGLLCCCWQATGALQPPGRPAAPSDYLSWRQKPQCSNQPHPPRSPRKPEPSPKRTITWPLPAAVPPTWGQK